VSNHFNAKVATNGIGLIESANGINLLWKRSKWIMEEAIKAAWRQTLSSQDFRGVIISPGDEWAFVQGYGAGHEAALAEVLNNPPKHKYWGAGEPDCPPDIKAPNGEIHTLQCKLCVNPKTVFCARDLLQRKEKN
jgi:hypothetical protein